MRRISKKIEKLEEENQKLKKEKSQQKLEYEGQIEKVKRKLNSAMKYISSMPEGNMKNQRISNTDSKKTNCQDFELLQEKTDLENKVKNLEAKCKKYKKKSDILKLKAQEVLEKFRDLEKQSLGIMSSSKTTSRCSKCHDSNMHSSFGRSPVTSNLKSPSFDLTLTSPQEKLYETSVEKVQERTPLSQIKEEGSSQHQEEEIEFNVYDYTKQKGSCEDNDTAEFGDDDIGQQEIRQNFKDLQDLQCKGDLKDGDQKKAWQLSDSDSSEIEEIVVEERETLIEESKLNDGRQTETLYEEYDFSSDKENEDINYSQKLCNKECKRTLKEIDINKQSSLSLHPSSLTYKLQSYLSPCTSPNPSQQISPSLHDPLLFPGSSSIDPCDPVKPGIFRCSQNKASPFYQKAQKVSPCQLDSEFNQTTSNFTYKSPSNYSYFNEFKSCDKMELEVSECSSSEY
ncbi:unnamed protein product [Moneuplotes crassus]|uniref:Uncharacterized protein n=1 Tax=Euplotes crassus TaxID=5936 RepID=A0AAD1U563_EUPCR|nr:unnamed protein product [Moneuplotes crassus]